MISSSEVNDLKILCLNESENNWKQKALVRQQQLRRAGIKIRDLQKSREKWKIKAKEKEKKNRELEKENQQLKTKNTEIIIEEKPTDHQYSLCQISISINQVVESGNSFRGVSKNWQIFVDNSDEIERVFGRQKLPSYSVVRTWWSRLGLFELQREKEKRDDWIWIMDLTLELGTEKCLVILGITEEKLELIKRRLNKCFNHEDVEVLTIKVMSSTRGELVKEILVELGEKTGIPRQIISDKGSDLFKGIKLYQSENMELRHSHDITHKMALLMKKELESDNKYSSFIKKCHQTRQKLQQTKNSYLMPPNQRSKSRYLNLDDLIKWGKNIIEYLKKLSETQQKSREEKLKILKELSWVKEYIKELDLWEKMLKETRKIEEKVKKEGLNQEAVQEYCARNKELKDNKNKLVVREKIEDYLVEETRNIEENETLIMSSDVIESLFGKYKLSSQKGPLKEIRRMILTIPLSTIKITKDLVKKALSMVKNIDVEKWEKEIFGQSMLSKRKMAFNFEPPYFISPVTN